MPASGRRRILRLFLGVNRKSGTIWRIGDATVEVVINGSHRVKADEGAEKSCRKAKTRRGQRARCKKRGGKPRSGNHVRPSTGERSSRKDRTEVWSEKRATSILERIETIRSWPQGQARRDAMRSLRKSFVSGRHHVEKIFGSSISWSRFVYLSNVPIFVANANLQISICPVSWEEVLKGTNVSEVRFRGPHRIRDNADRNRIMATSPALPGRARYTVGSVVSADTYERSRRVQRPPRHTLPMNKTIAQDEFALRPRQNQVGVTNQAKVCRWCGRRKGVVHGNMSCDATKNARGHQFVSP